MVTVKGKKNFRGVPALYAIVQRRRVGKTLELFSFFFPCRESTRIRLRFFCFFLGSLFSTPRFLIKGVLLLCLLPRLFVRIIRDGESNCRDDVTIIIISFIFSFFLFFWEFQFSGLYNTTTLPSEGKKKRRKMKWRIEIFLRSFVFVARPPPVSNGDPGPVQAKEWPSLDCVRFLLYNWMRSAHGIRRPLSLSPTVWCARQQRKQHPSFPHFFKFYFYNIPICCCPPAGIVLLVKYRVGRSLFIFKFLTAYKIKMAVFLVVVVVWF
jgi:hypothetical protein